MEDINNNQIIDELKEYHTSKNKLEKTRRKIKITAFVSLCFNTAAGITIGSVYFFVNETVFLILGGIVAVTGISLYFILRILEKKIIAEQKKFVI